MERIRLNTVRCKSHCCVACIIRPIQEDLFSGSLSDQGLFCLSISHFIGIHQQASHVFRAALLCWYSLYVASTVYILCDCQQHPDINTLCLYIAFPNMVLEICLYMWNVSLFLQWWHLLPINSRSVWKMAQQLSKHEPCFVCVSDWPEFTKIWNIWNANLPPPTHTHKMQWEVQSVSFTSSVSFSMGTLAMRTLLLEQETVYWR